MAHISCCHEFGWTTMVLPMAQGVNSAPSSQTL